MADAPTIAIDPAAEKLAKLFSGSRIPPVLQRAVPAIIALFVSVGIYFLLDRLGFTKWFNIPISAVIGIGGLVALLILSPEKVGKLLLGIGSLVGGFVLFFVMASYHLPPWLVALSLISFIIIVLAVLGKIGIFTGIINILLLVLLATGQLSIYLPLNPSSPLAVAVQGQEGLWADMLGKAKEGAVSFEEAVTRQYKMATGEYQVGVQEQQNRRLGVFLVDARVLPQIVQRGRHEFFSLIGTVKTESFASEEELRGRVSCYDSAQSLTRGIVMTEPEFDITAGINSYPVQCEFKVADFQAGARKVALEVVFDFTTDAVMRVGMVDSASFKGEERVELAIYTPGPLSIGMSAGSSPVVIFKNKPAAGPVLDMTIDRNIGWQGEVADIEHVTIVVPPGLKVKRVNTLDVSKYLNMCKMTALNEQECTVEKSKLDLLRDVQQGQQAVKMPLRLNVLTEVSDMNALLGKTGYSITQFRASTKYTYRARSELPITVQKEAPMPAAVP